MTSENTIAASSNRFAGSLSLASSGVSANTVAIVVVIIINFTVSCLLPVCRAFEHGIRDLRRVGGQTFSGRL
jgi:hypothetical protein